eukprot:9318755-Pyramimonas_sp.AAC.1
MLVTAVAPTTPQDFLEPRMIRQNPCRLFVGTLPRNVEAERAHVHSNATHLGQLGDRTNHLSVPGHGEQR